MSLALRLVMSLGLLIIGSAWLPHTARADTWGPLDFVWFPYTQMVLFDARAKTTPLVMLAMEDTTLRWRVDFRTSRGAVENHQSGGISLDAPEHCSRIDIYAENVDAWYPEPGVFYDLSGPPMAMRGPPPRSEQGDVLSRLRASDALGLARQRSPDTTDDDLWIRCQGAAVVSGSPDGAKLDIEVLAIDGERWGKARARFPRKINSSHLIFVPLTAVADIPFMLAEVFVIGSLSLMGIRY